MTSSPRMAGRRRGIEMCVLCHTPQTTDPDTGNTLNLPVMAHKIHMGSELPSVQAGKPYQIIGFQGECGGLLDRRTSRPTRGAAKCATSRSPAPRRRPLISPGRRAWRAEPATTT